jgi:adenylate cyclase
VPLLRFRALGKPVVDGPGGPVGGSAAQRRPLALLALLASAGERGISRDKIVAYLWPEIPSDRAAHRLTQVLYSVRKDLGVDDLFLGSSDLRLNSAAISNDVGDFLTALADRKLERAVELYGGPFLDGFYLSDAAEFERWVEAERSELARRFGGAVEELAEQERAKGEDAAAARWWGRLAEADPLDARVALRYMEALARGGDRVGALRFARSHEARLKEEFDAAPEPAVRAAAERLRTAADDVLSIAVLPFVNMGPERDNEYFSDGLTEELTNALTQVPGLRVASRTSAFTFKGKGLDAREIGARLGVNTLVEGSTRKVGNRIRVTAQLISADDGYHLWSQTYDRTLADVFALQEEISQAIVQALPLPGSSRTASRVRPPTSVLEAYTLYLRGRYFALKRTVESLRVALEYFEQAIELDPEYSLAYAGMGECWALRGFEDFGDLPPIEAMPRAKAAVLRALELEPRLAEGHAWDAVIGFLFDRDWHGAETAFRRALELKPTSSLAHAWYAVFLTAMGRHDEAIARSHHAEQMDPLSVTIHMVVGLCYHYACRFEEALQQHRAALVLDPDNVRLHTWVARTYSAAGRHQEGLAVLEASIERLGRAPLLLVQLGFFLAVLGRREEARAVIRELDGLAERQYVSPLLAGPIYQPLGEEEEFFRRCDAAVEQHSGYLPFLAVEPVWHSIRGKPRFQALLRRIGL